MAKLFYDQIGESEIRIMNLDLKPLKSKKLKTILNILSSPKEYNAYFDQLLNKINNLNSGNDFSCFILNKI